MPEILLKCPLLVPDAFELVRSVQSSFLAGVLLFQVHDIFVGLVAVLVGLYFIVCRHIVMHAIRELLRAGIAEFIVWFAAGSQ